MVLLHTHRTHLVLVFMTLITYYLDMRKPEDIHRLQRSSCVPVQIDHTNARLIYEVDVGLSLRHCLVNKKMFPLCCLND